LFAKTMGVGWSSLCHWLSGSQPIKPFILNAARWAALRLGAPIEIDRIEIRRLRGKGKAR
jgi:hypothetical protein